MQQPEVTNLVTNIPKPVKWVIPDTIRTDRATHLIVQQQGSEFLLFFFETKTVLFSGTPEEQIAAYQNLPELEAKCVAKIVMGVENAMVAVNNLIESVNRFNRMLQEMKGQENAKPNS
jgi:hypothetical protein